MNLSLSRTPRSNPISSWAGDKKRTLRRNIFRSCEKLLALARPSPRRLPVLQTPRRLTRRISYPQLVSSPIDPADPSWPSWGIREERYDEDGDLRVEEDEFEGESGGRGKWWRESEESEREWEAEERTVMEFREEPRSRWSTSFSTLEHQADASFDDYSSPSLPLYSLASPAPSYATGFPSLPPSPSSRSSLEPEFSPTPRILPYHLPPIPLSPLAASFPTPPPSPLLRRAPRSTILRLNNVKEERESEFTRRAMEFLDEESGDATGELMEDLLLGSGSIGEEESDDGETILFEGTGEVMGETMVEVSSGEKEERWESLVAFTRRSV